MRFNYGLAIKALIVAAILGIPYLIFVGQMEPTKAIISAFPGLLTAGLAWIIWKTESTPKRL